ncbi:hypothetical protein RV17_GL000628 [Enterococcus thailandicus]|nr:hypothetical protein RV17_GL000628 [Enterococcus thailandicus]
MKQAVSVDFFRLLCLKKIREAIQLLLSFIKMIAVSTIVKKLFFG